VALENVQNHGYNLNFDYFDLLELPIDKTTKADAYKTDLAYADYEIVIGDEMIDET
jgi:hypothetical protein